MRRKLRITALFMVGGGLAIAPGCADRLPTFTDPEGFPENLIPTSIEYVLDAEDFLRSAAVYELPTNKDDFPGLVVANDFDGVLNAHVVADLGTFPDTIVYDNAVDSTFSYTSGLVSATIPDTLNVSSPQLSFYLWELVESFEADSVTWERRIDRPGNPVNWTQPGGTRGTLIGVARWDRTTANAVGDSLFWTVPALVMERLANDQAAGLLVTLEGDNERADISRLALQASIRPTARQDTTVTRPIASGEQTFIYTPEAPRPADVLRVGGLRSDRSVLRINLPTVLPGCAPQLTCPTVHPTQVSINRIDLELETVPVTGGYRPLTPGLIAMRQVLQPELGSKAPLGFYINTPLNGTGLPNVASFPNYFEDQFTAGAADRVSLVISGAAAAAYAAEETELAIALLVEPEASRFDVAWFSQRPKLRIIYTLPQTPELP